MSELTLPTPARSAPPRTKSAVLGIVAFVVLGGAAVSVLALEACAENSPAQPMPATAPTTGSSSAPKPSATPPAPPPAPPLPPPPT